LRSAFRAIRKPLVAIGIYLFVLYMWHWAFAFEAALESPVVHALQHQSFVFASLLVWWPAIEPKRRRLRGELWKIGHIMGARLGGMFLAMAFIIASSTFYAGYYGDRARDHGFAPLTDQQVAGGLMLGVDLLVMFFALAFFFFRAAQDHDRAEAADRAAATAA
jgi:cytochrome c oxidase assembly factor CtaG